ncbi:MAG: 50S ribosomal protein L27 [Clostridia bacterium]|nr:50S ribosomal protein L27 [Clostridia bacterium]
MIIISLFAHKKGVGSTRNGRDSESKRLGAKRLRILARQGMSSLWHRERLSLRL